MDLLDRFCEVLGTSGRRLFLPFLLLLLLEVRSPQIPQKRQGLMRTLNGTVGSLPHFSGT